MRLASKLLEPVTEMLTSPPLGIRARRPRPKLIDEILSLGEGVHAYLAVHALRYARPGATGTP